MAAAVELIGSKQAFRFVPKTIETLAAGYAGSLRRTKLSLLSTDRAYMFAGLFAKLEQALISFTTGFLKHRGFEFISVPDIISPEILDGCGMERRQGRHNMIYFLDEQRHGRFALSGTSEMSIAALHRNKIIPKEQLPIKLTAMSRCYRAEVSDVQEGIYRVHEFTKVEMFSLCQPDDSKALLEEFVTIQKDIVSSLGLHAQVLDMPKEELGLAASRKFDIEAWMPGTQRYGEISSASNCKDFQSSRLNIRYQEKNSQEDKLPFVHTVNGTACAIPRMIIAILEQNQLSNGVVTIPEVLRPYFDNAVTMSKPTGPTGLYWRKSRKGN